MTDTAAPAPAFAAMATDLIADPSQTPAATAPPLGSLAASGFAWVFALTIFARLCTMLSQIGLARLLLPDDYGVVSLALAAAVIPGILRDGGVGQILIQRQRDFARLANPAFWLTFTLGLLAGTALAISAPWVARVYHSPQLESLLFLLAANAVVSSACVVPAAKLQIDLRLRLSAIISTASAILTPCLSILLATLHFGSASLILPMLIVSVLRLICFWLLSPVGVKWRLQVRIWGMFLTDSATLIITGFCWTVTSQGDYVILGRFAEKDVIGFYFFAFNLSMQTVQLLGGSLSSVLFPTLSRLRHEPERQRDAFIRICRISTAITIPLALLPIPCARPLISLLFGEKWLPSAFPLQILSVASALATVGLPSSSFLMAQGRNRTSLLHAIAMACYFIGMVTVLTWSFGVIGTAIAVTTFQAICSGMFLYLAIRPFGKSASNVAKILRVPIIFATLAVITAMLAGRFTEQMFPLRFLIICVTSIVFMGFYGALIRLFARDIWDECCELVLSRLRPVFRKRSAFTDTIDNALISS